MATSRLIVTSGPVGTRLVQMLAPGKGVLSLAEVAALPYERPDLLERLYAEYVAAGADMLLCATLTANAQYRHCSSQSEMERCNRLAVRLAQEADESCGNATAKLCAMLSMVRQPDMSQACTAVGEQVRVLADCGMNCFMLETLTDIDTARYLCDTVSAALAGSGVDGDLHISFTPRLGVSLYDDTPLATAADIVSGYGLESIGINCVLPSETNLAAVRLLRRHSADTVISVRPCAVLRDVSVSPAEMVQSLEPLVAEGAAGIVGPCCGGDGRYVATLKKELALTDTA